MRVVRNSQVPTGHSRDISTTTIQTFYSVLTLYIQINLYIRYKKYAIRWIGVSQKLWPLLDLYFLGPPRENPRSEPWWPRPRFDTLCPRKFPRVGIPLLLSVLLMAVGPLEDFVFPESLRARAAEHPLTQLARSWLGSCRGRLAVFSNLIGFVYLASGLLISSMMQSAIVLYAALEGWTGLGPQRAAVLAASSSEGSCFRCPTPIILFGQRTLKCLIFLTNSASRMKSLRSATADPRRGRNPVVR